jgi:hypothetical protein
MEAGEAEVRISAGIPASQAVVILRILATDISSTLEVTAGQHGEVPREFCWELNDYDLVVWLHKADGGRILMLSYWTKQDFRLPKADRYDQEKVARSITFDTKNRTYAIEGFPTYFPKGSVADFEESYYGPVLAALEEPVLSSAQKERGYFACRILCLPGFRSQASPAHPAVIRYEKKGGRIFRRVVVLSDRNLDETAKPSEVEVQKSEVDNLVASLEKARFWKMPKEDTVDALNMYPGETNTECKDGARVIIEAVRDGEYRVRIRGSPHYQMEQRDLSSLVKFYTSQFQKAGFLGHDEAK